MKPKIIQIPALNPGDVVANANCAGFFTVVRRVRKNVYEVRLPENWHQPKFAGTTVEMQRNQLTKI